MKPVRTVDLLIVGGGINGAGIARDAVGRGLSVAVVDLGDVAGATSSASTKLIHGGLRYLEHGEYRLVAKALAERENLLRIAPHIAWPLRFVMPHVASLRPRWMIRLGLWLYDHLGGRISLPRSSAARLDRLDHPSGLRLDVRHAFEYSDAWVDDARLVLLNLKSAEQQGAVVLVRTRLVSAERIAGSWNCVLEDMSTVLRPSTTVKAGAIVNATGPWVAWTDELLNPNRDAGAPRAAVKLVRGSHIVVRRLHAGPHAHVLQNEDRRIVFMIPYEHDYTLIGTTDAPQASMSSTVEVSAEEERYLLAAANAYLERPIGPGDIVWRYAGVRPLFDDEVEDPSAVTRDYRVVLSDRDNAPCVSVYGGKITTYRHLAEDVLAALAPWLQRNAIKLRGPWTATSPLPSGEFAADGREAEIARLAVAYPRLDATFLRRLFSRHGLTAYAILGDARVHLDLGRYFGGGLFQREAEYCIEHEWARQADDVLWRRTKCGLHMSPSQREAFATWMSAKRAEAQVPAGPATASRLSASIR